MHFFNPVPVLKLVEVIRAEATSDETAAAIVALARELGKEPVEARDVAGFVSNRILMPFLNEAVHALAEGIADAAGIDTVAKLGFGHPMGPLALADLIGLDTCVAIMEVLARGLGDARLRAVPAAARARRRRPPRPQVRRGLLQLRLEHISPQITPFGCRSPGPVRHCPEARNLGGGACAPAGGGRRSGAARTDPDDVRGCRGRGRRGVDVGIGAPSIAPGPRT